MLWEVMSRRVCMGLLRYIPDYLTVKLAWSQSRAGS